MFCLTSNFYFLQVIRNIPPNTDVERIYIVATNQVGLSSPKGQLKEKVCRTLETSRHGQLVRELNAAAAITGPYFDSDFYTVIDFPSISLSSFISRGALLDFLFPTI